MIQFLKQILNRAHFITLTVFFAILSVMGHAQTPTHIPREETSPVDFFESTENIIFFIVIPVLIIILYFIWRRNLRKQRNDEEKN